MPDVPEVTIVDPGAPHGHSDVLDTGEPREPRVPGRWRAAGLAVVLLVGAGVVGGRAALEARAEQRARDAAFAIADEVHLGGELGTVFGFSPEGGSVLSAEVVVDALDGDRGRNRVTGVRFEGEGLRPRDVDLSALRSLPATLYPEADLDCGPVTAGRYPEQVSVVLDVVPRSGVVHPQRFALAAPALREAALQACNLPDPDAEVTVEVQGGASGDVLLFLDPVPRSDDTLTIEGLLVPGFEVLPVPGLRLPSVLPPDTGGVYAFPLRVTDCAAARRGAGVSVRLRVGGVLETRLASTEVSQPQPGAVPAAELLRRLVDEAC